MRPKRHHIFTLGLATALILCVDLRAADPEPKPGIVQELNDARLKLFDWVRTKAWVNPDIKMSSPKGQGNANGSGTAFGSGAGNGNGGTGGNRGGSSNSNGANSTASSGGASSGNGSDSGGGNQKKTDEFNMDDPTAGLDNSPGSVISTNGSSQAFDMWYPMCLFIDPQAESEGGANAAIKGMVDDAARCKVNLVVFPITVSPNGYAKGDPETTNNQQRAACNLAGLDNANRASTSICVNDSQMADKMCKQKCVKGPNPPKGKECGPDGEHTTGTGGCAQVQSNDAEKEVVRKFMAGLQALVDRPSQPNATPEDVKAAAEAKARIEEIKGDGSLEGGATTSGVAPSIEDKGSCNAGVVGHEAIGHSQFGHPNGASDGNGIGLNKTVQGGEESGGWSDEGCEALHRNGFKNSGRWKWDPNRTTYYTEVKDASKQWNLYSGKTVRGPRNGPPMAGPITPQEPGGTPGRVAFDDTVSKARPKLGDDGKPPTTPTGTPEKEVVGPTGRHKGQQPGSVVGELVQNLKEAAEPPSDSKGGEQPPGSDVFVKNAPGPSTSGVSSARVTFDDGAKKGAGKYTDYGTSGRVSEFANASNGGGRSPASVGSGRTSVGFDDGAKKGSGGYTNYGGGSGEGDGSGTSIAAEGSAMKVIPAGAPTASQLDGNFFNELGQADQDRQRAEAARERRPAVVQEGGSRRTSADKRAIVR